MLHLVKLCVGIDTPAALRRAQRLRALERRAAGLDPRPLHRTRAMPRRRREVLDGGSLYWVIVGRICLRQRILELVADTRADGRSCAVLVLDPDLVATEPVPQRPFQGWRYLEAERAPTDRVEAAADAELAPGILRAMEAMGLHWRAEPEAGACRS